MKKLILTVMLSLMVANISAIETEKKVATAGLAAGAILPVTILLHHKDKLVIKNIENSAVAALCAAFASGSLAFFNFKMKIIKNADTFELFLASFAFSSALAALLLSDLKKYLDLAGLAC